MHRSPACAYQNEQKIFASFFQKRRPHLLKKKKQKLLPVWGIALTQAVRGVAASFV